MEWTARSIVLIPPVEHATNVLRQRPLDLGPFDTIAYLTADSHESGTNKVQSRENHGHSARYFQKAEDEGQRNVTEVVQKRWQGRGANHSSPKGGGTSKARQARQAQRA